MPRRNAPRNDDAAVARGPEEAVFEQIGVHVKPDAASLLAEMAARGRARLQQIEAQGTPPWEAVVQDPTWQKRWDDLVARVRRELPDDLTPEEIEAEITRASEEVRNERLARGR